MSGKSSSDISDDGSDRTFQVSFLKGVFFSWDTLYIKENWKIISLNRF